MATSASSPPSESPETSTSWSTRRWVVLGIAAIFFGFVLYEMINPFPGQPYMEVPHGDHVHYVPKDRNPDQRLSDFPTTPPGPNERIMPNGQIVEVEPSE
jgi:hypothetical protein